MSNRRSVLTTTSLVASGLSLLPAAAGGNTSGSRQISETRKVRRSRHPRQARNSQLRLIGVSTLDGRIGAAQIHGALRILDTLHGPGRETVNGTEFDAGGSRSFVINLHYTITNGRTLDIGTGRWTVAPAPTRVRTARSRSAVADRWAACNTVGLSGGLRIYTTNGFSARTH